MSSLRQVLAKHVARAARSDSKRDLNRLVDHYYTGPGLGNVVRAPVKGTRGQSIPSTEVDPEA